MGHAEKARLSFGACTGEGAGAVTEKFRFEQLWGNGRAVYGDECLHAAGALGMDEFGDQFFSDPGFPDQHNGAVGNGNGCAVPPQGVHFFTFADHIGFVGGVEIIRNVAVTVVLLLLVGKLSGKFVHDDIGTVVGHDKFDIALLIQKWKTGREPVDTPHIHQTCDGFFCAHGFQNGGIGVYMLCHHIVRTFSKNLFLGKSHTFFSRFICNDIASIGIGHYDAVVTLLDDFFTQITMFVSVCSVCIHKIPLSVECVVFLNLIINKMLLICNEYCKTATQKCAKLQLPNKGF